MKFLKNQDGASAIEYGLIAALIAIVLVMMFNPGPTEDEPLPLSIEKPAETPPG